MRLRIFSVHHVVPDIYLANEIFTPFVTGVALPPHPHFRTDQSGDTIANRVSHSEMRAHYHVWKNPPQTLDYVGFQHYRRLFFFPFLAGHTDFPIQSELRIHFLKNRLASFVNVNPARLHQYRAFLQQLDSGERLMLRERLGHYDIVVPRALHPPEESLREQYAKWHNARDWDALLTALSRTGRFDHIAKPPASDMRELSPYCLYIMRWSLFDDYMSFWHQLCASLEPLVEIPDHPFQFRTFSFLAERIFTIWLYHVRMEFPELRVLETPIVFSRDLTA